MAKITTLMYEAHVAEAILNPQAFKIVSCMLRPFQMSTK